MYTAIQPAPGVRVLPHPRAKVHLSMSQAKAARKIPVDRHGNYIGPGVIRCKPAGGGLTLDIHSTVKSCPRMLKPTRGPNAKRGPHSPKPRPMNLCCRRPLPTEAQKHDQLGREELKNLKKMHARLCGFGRHLPDCNRTGYDANYSQRRQVFIAEHPTLAAELLHIEQAHEH